MAEPTAAPAGHNFKSVKDVELSAKTRMDKSISDMQHTIAGIRTGRASVSIFDNLRVDYYGSPTPINQVATISVPEARLLVIQPWDRKMLTDIEKEIQRSDLGINPKIPPIELISPDFMDHVRRHSGGDPEALAGMQPQDPPYCRKAFSGLQAYAILVLR